MRSKRSRIVSDRSLIQESSSTTRDILMCFVLPACRGLRNRKLLVAQRGWRAQLAARWRDAVFLRDADVRELPVGARGRRRRWPQPRRQQPHRPVPLPVLREDVPAAQLSEEARAGKDTLNRFLDCQYLRIYATGSLQLLSTIHIIIASRVDTVTFKHIYSVMREMEIFIARNIWIVANCKHARIIIRHLPTDKRV